jgi:hypothetical protein
MADKWPLANGVWSNAANWNDSTLPGVGDDAYADGKTITIDQDVTVLSVRTTQRSWGVAGGGFTLNDGRTLNADCRAGSTDCVTFSAASPATATINGDCFGSTTTGTTYAAQNKGTGTLTINGNCTGGNGNGRRAVQIGSSGPININGNVTGGSGTNAYGVINNSSGVLSVIGNVTGGSGTGADAIVHNSTTGTINVVGTVTGGSGVNARGIWNTSNGAVNVTGDVHGGSSDEANGLVGGSIGPCNIVGNLVPAVASAVATIAGGGRIYVNGNLQSVASGRAAYGGGILVIHPSNTVEHKYRDWDGASVGAERTLSTGSSSPDYPAEGDVRDGVAYDGGGLTGTLELPAEADVKLGVGYGDGGTEFTGTLAGGGGSVIVIPAPGRIL